MAYTGTGTEADPYLVDNITDLITCMGIGGFIKLTADIDGTNSPTTNGNSISVNSFTLDGDGHSLNNFAWIKTNNARTFCFFTSSYKTITMKNLTFNISLIWNYKSTESNNHIVFANGTYVNYINCDIKYKAYLSEKASLESEYRYSCSGTLMTGSYDNSFTNCNVICDVYLITATNSLSSIIYGSNFYDSIIKINIYDPMGWGKAAKYPIFNVGLGNNSGALSNCTIDNCGVFVTYNADVDMVSDRKYIYITGGGMCTVVNSYFVYENTGVVSLTPVINYTYFLTYAFYDITKAPDLARSLCTYHFDSSQFMGLTTDQCKSRSTFEGPTAVLPFKLKQSVEP